MDRTLFPDGRIAVSSGYVYVGPQARYCHPCEAATQAEVCEFCGERTVTDMPPGWNCELPKKPHPETVAAEEYFRAVYGADDCCG